MQPKERHDSEKGYCRKLGHWLTFAYCRSERSGIPCPRLRDCWFETLPVDDYIAECLGPAELESFCESPRDRIATLVELAMRAREES